MGIFTNGIIGSVRNRVGNVITYRSKGQDIMRSAAANVANPRTEAQQGQRTRLANLVNFYKANRSWMERYAFARRPTKWSVYNAFVSANIGGTSVYLTKSEAAQGVAIVAPYKVTDGSIPSIIHTTETGGLGRTDLYCGAGFEVTADTTINELAEAIIQNNNTIQAGWQLSLIINYQQSTGDVFYILPRAYEITLTLGDSRLVRDFMPADVMDVQPTADGNNSSVCFIGGTQGQVCGYAFVLSNKTSATIDVSTQYMMLTDTSIYNSYTEEAQRQRAIASYGSSADAFLAPGYGGDGGSNPAVVIPSSILTASIAGRTANVGEYLGAWGGEEAGTALVSFNRDVLTETIEAVSLAWSASGGGSVTYTTGFTATGATLTVAVPAAQTPNPTAPITSIVVTFNTGATLRASFKASDDIEE